SQLPAHRSLFPMSGFCAFSPLLHLFLYLPIFTSSNKTKQTARTLQPGGCSLLFTGPVWCLFQLDHRHAAFAFTIAAQAEALDHPVSAQMLLNGVAQCAGAVAVDQIDSGLTVQDGAVDERIRLLDGFVHSQT